MWGHQPLIVCPGHILQLPASREGVSCKMWLLMAILCMSCLHCIRTIMSYSTCSCCVPTKAYHYFSKCTEGEFVSP